MSSPDPAPLTRYSAFSFACHACGRCCHHMRIVLSPYEVARLAAARGISTREFIATCTEQGGTVLRFLPHGACIFLQDGKCAVHPDRPMVCRLYPLGRCQASGKGEWFIQARRHPECPTHVASSGTIDEFLASQDLTRHLLANDRYFTLLERMIAVLTRLPGMSPADADPKRIEAATDAAMVADFQDVDAAVTAHCARHNLPVPADLEARINLHLAALEEWLDDLERSLPPNTAQPGNPQQ